MQTPTIVFNIAEKLALVNAIDSVIVADQHIHQAELNLFNQLMKRLDFDSNFIVQARNISKEQSLLILRRMPEEKKKAMAEILDEVANVDGFYHEKEMDIISGICETAGIYHDMV